MARTTQPVLATGTDAARRLSTLLLDVDNPRFGGVLGAQREQADVLDFIVERFGVDDVLSSLAVNGYFAAEPLVCRQITGRTNQAVVAEGNRRLAACLIITGDARAARHSRRTEQYRAIWQARGSKRIDPVPVILFAADQGRDLLSYLGVRHIAASQPWDSYAKAAWVARVVEREGVSVPDVAQMIGDQHRTIARLLEGYHFIQQTIANGGFRPQDSQRRGRGSVSEYPFSWVYTILGYSTVRRYLQMPDDATRPNPVPDAARSRASLLVNSMFGDRTRGRSAAISDSRQIGALASVFASAEKISLLEAGRSVEEIERSTKPIEERLRQGLAEVRALQADLLAGLSEQGVGSGVAENLVTLATRNRRTARDIESRLTALANEEDDEEGADA